MVIAVKFLSAKYTVGGLQGWPHSVASLIKMARVVELLSHWRLRTSVVMGPSQSGGVKSVPVISARGLYLSTSAPDSGSSASLVFDWVISGGAVSLLTCLL